MSTSARKKRFLGCLFMLAMIIIFITTYKERPPLFISGFQQDNIIHEAQQTNSVNKKPTLNLSLEQRYQERKNLVEKCCREYRKLKLVDRISDVKISKTKSYFLISHKHRLIWRIVQKCGLCTWREHYAKLLGYKDHLDLHYNFYRYDMQSTGKESLVRDWSELQHKGYFSFMFTRHPFSRLLSAFKNKFNREPSRRNKTDGGTKKLSIIRMVSNGILKEKQSSNATITFAEFVSWLISHPNDPDDVHWTPVTQLVYPCDLTYTVIGKQETFEEDTNYIISLNNLPLSPSLRLNPTNAVDDGHYYSSITKPQLLALYEKYKADFDMYGYDYKDYLKYVQP